MSLYIFRRKKVRSGIYYLNNRQKKAPSKKGLFSFDHSNRQFTIWMVVCMIVLSVEMVFALA
jgi:hypothetical protein